MESTDSQLATIATFPWETDVGCRILLHLVRFSHLLHLWIEELQMENIVFDTPGYNIRFSFVLLQMGRLTAALITLKQNKLIIRLLQCPTECRTQNQWFIGCFVCVSACVLHKYHNSPCVMITMRLFFSLCSKWDNLVVLQYQLSNERCLNRIVLRLDSKGLNGNVYNAEWSLYLWRRWWCCVGVGVGNVSSRFHRNPHNQNKRKKVSTVACDVIMWAIDKPPPSQSIINSIPSPFHQVVTFCCMH